MVSRLSRKSGRKHARWWTALIATMLVAGACSSGSTIAPSQSAVAPSSAPSPATTAAESAAPSTAPSLAPSQPPASGGIVISVPESVQQYYAGYQYFVPLQPNPYAQWTPKPAPWKICENDSYLGNPWRQDSLAEFQKLYKQLQDAGLAAPGEANVTNSNNNVDLQISQMASQVRDGCDVIITIAGSTTGMCTAIHDASQKGVLVITDESPVNCPDGLNVTFNPYWDMVEGTQAVAKALGGKGSVVIMVGLPGYNQTVASTQAITDVLTQYPDIKVVGSINGQWTPSIAKTEMIKFLATHPGKIDGLLDQGAMSVGGVQAFKQSGRPLPKVNDYSGECSFLALAHEFPDIATSAIFQGGAAAMYEAFHVAMRMLAGQQPTVQTLIYPLPEVTPDNFGQYYDSSMTVQSTCFAGPKNAVPDSYFDPLFSGGAAAATLTP